MDWTRFKSLTARQAAALCLYYGFARYLPGKPGDWLRTALCRHIFQKCGKRFLVCRMAFFGIGTGIEIGERSAIGIRAHIPRDTVIGNDVLMAPDCVIMDRNHRYIRSDIPINRQGVTERKRTVIGDDVWIGREVLVTPGRTIRRGCVIAARCVLSKDFEAYSVVGGNPPRVLKKRIRAGAGQDGGQG